MDDLRVNLHAIGFAEAPRDPICWRTERTGEAAAAVEIAPANEPACSLALRRWRDRLARDARPSPYRITRRAG
jgi:hypothetical protein